MECLKKKTAVDVVIDKRVDVKGIQNDYLVVLKNECATDQERLDATINLVKLTCQSPDHTYLFDPRKLKQLIRAFEELSFDIKEKCKQENAAIADAYKNVATEPTGQALHIIHLAIASALGDANASRQLAMIYAQKDQYNIPFGDENFNDVNALNYAQLAQQQGYPGVWPELEDVYSKQGNKKDWEDICRNEWSKFSTDKVATSCYDIVAALYPQETIDWIVTTCYNVVAANLEYLATLNTNGPNSGCSIQ